MTCSIKIKKNLNFLFLWHVDPFVRMLHICPVEGLEGMTTRSIAKRLTLTPQWNVFCIVCISLKVNHNCTLCIIYRQYANGSTLVQYYTSIKKVCCASFMNNMYSLFVFQCDKSQFFISNRHFNWHRRAGLATLSLFTYLIFSTNFLMRPWPPFLLDVLLWMFFVVPNWIHFAMMLCLYQLFLLFIQHLLSALFTIKRALMRYEKYMNCIHKTF